MLNKCEVIKNVRKHGVCVLCGSDIVENRYSTCSGCDPIRYSNVVLFELINELKLRVDELESQVNPESLKPKKVRKKKVAAPKIRKGRKV